MAISLETFEKKTNSKMFVWQYEAEQLEQWIDEKLELAISENIIPNPKNKNFVMRYKFPGTTSKEAKDILRVRYGNLGWIIKEDIDYSEANYYGYFDFYKPVVKGS